MLSHNELTIKNPYIHNIHSNPNGTDRIYLLKNH